MLSILRSLAWCGHLVLVWICARDTQRAEYLADELSARAAGSTAATGLLDVLVVREVATMLAAREARRGVGPAGWRSAVQQSRTNIGPRMRRLRQLSVRDEVSLFASHPPSGLRAAMVTSRPYQTAAVVLTETDSARLDGELATYYERTRRTLAGG